MFNAIITEQFANNASLISDNKNLLKFRIASKPSLWGMLDAKQACRDESVVFSIFNVFNNYLPKAK